MDNSVLLVGYYGGDLTHAAAAWTSTASSLDSEQISRVPALLKQLAIGSDGNSHATPFERSLLHFSVTNDVASHIHLLKHRTLAVNGESARYREFRNDRFYIPDDWDVEDATLLTKFSEQAFASYHNMVDRLIAKGYTRSRAKESARYFLPYATQTLADISMDFRAFVNFQRLRNAPHAQREIRNIANKMLECVKTETDDAFRYSLEAFGL